MGGRAEAARGLLDERRRVTVALPPGVSTTEVGLKLQPGRLGGALGPLGVTRQVRFSMPAKRSETMVMESVVEALAATERVLLASSRVMVGGGGGTGGAGDPGEGPGEVG